MMINSDTMKCLSSSTISLLWDNFCSLCLVALSMKPICVYSTSGLEWSFGTYFVGAFLQAFRAKHIWKSSPIIFDLFSLPSSVFSLWKVRPGHNLQCQTTLFFLCVWGVLNCINAVLSWVYNNSFKKNMFTTHQICLLIIKFNSF